MADEFLNELQEFMLTKGIEKIKVEQVIKHITRQYGGIPIYIKMDKVTNRTQRDKEIFERFNGKNIINLCRDFGLTAQQIRRIVATKRAESLTH